MRDLELEIDLLAPPELVYKGWLDSYIHGAISEALAAIDPKVDGEYRLWSGSVQGRFTQLITNKKISMTWRTVEFPITTEDSFVTITLKEIKAGTRFCVFHQKIPDVFFEQFRFAWQEYYFPRMQNFFIVH